MAKWKSSTEVRRFEEREETCAGMTQGDGKERDKG